MTFAASIPALRRLRGLAGPDRIGTGQISVVVPVRDNPEGVRRLVAGLDRLAGADDALREVIVVDNLSSPPLSLGPNDSSVPMALTQCRRPGPASARNDGAALASGEWLLFLDSDCVPLPGLLDGYRRSLNGSVAYAGRVRSVGRTWLDRYYETQRILVPPPVHGDRPAFLVTANALVWRPAFVDVTGFDESFELAAGEDVDLGLRLWGLGTLSYAEDAVVEHDFESTLGSFWRRFVRYGRGNRQVEERHAIDLRPRRFRAVDRALSSRAAAVLQYLALRAGYRRGP